MRTAGNLSLTAQGPLANLITIFLGITIAFQMKADQFLTWGTLLVMALGLFAFVFDTMGGVLFAKLLNIFLPKGRKDQPHGRRRRHFRVPHERQGDPEDGLERGQPRITC